MQLSDFISETLVQIANAIDAANEQLVDSTARVNPPNVQVVSDKVSTIIYGHIHAGALLPPVHLIRFDVAVYAAEGTEKKGGIGVMVGTLGLGGQRKSDASESTTSRIQFGIPMLLPTAKEK